MNLLGDEGSNLDSRIQSPMSCHWTIPQWCRAILAEKHKRPPLCKGAAYLPAARRWKRVALSILRCFFLRMRLRRFLISEPMTAKDPTC